MEYSVVVVSEGHDAPGLTYIAPYASTSIAEQFMESGRDVLIVYDEPHPARPRLSGTLVLLRRPPGREAFPGISSTSTRVYWNAPHICARSLAAALSQPYPLSRPRLKNIAAYIPTNLISITDGQLYLSPTLFELGVLPAVDIHVRFPSGRSKRSSPAIAPLPESQAAYSQFEELEAFSRFGTRLDDNTRKIIEHGERLRACLKQPQFEAVPCSSRSRCSWH